MLINRIINIIDLDKIEINNINSNSSNSMIPGRISIKTSNGLIIYHNNFNK